MGIFKRQEPLPSSSLELQPSGAAPSGTAPAASGSLDAAPTASGSLGHKASGTLPIAAPPSAASQLTKAEERTLAHVKHVAYLMDNCITIPVVGYKIGMESIIGLVPYAGAQLCVGRTGWVHQRTGALGAQLKQLC